MLTGRPTPKNSTQPYFQGMLSMPNERFGFVITNLSDVGMVDFNILHSPHRVSEVDPGPSYGVNEVNELHANQSYDIEADQRTNRAMVLKGKTEKKFDPVTNQRKYVPLTVDGSGSTKDKANEGLHFYLSVVPDAASPTLVKKFKEGTTWKAVPGFVRKSLSPPQSLGVRYRRALDTYSYSQGSARARAYYGGLTIPFGYPTDQAPPRALDFPPSRPTPLASVARPSARFYSSYAHVQDRPHVPPSPMSAGPPPPPPSAMSAAPMMLEATLADDKLCDEICVALAESSDKCALK